ncbi:MAG: phospholipase D-like domain-containing protein [Candidatus Thermoplasmatota archaeon]|nr:phospholipase D-like domain-containing protein [Candidatus Thermoplasmatota archaeon]
MQYKLLLSPWKNEFIEIVSKAKEELFISSPFVNVEGVKILSDSIQTKIRMSLITNLTTRNIVNGVTEPVALLELYKRFSQVKISSLGRLHAKVYLVDDNIGIITSANLTSGGLVNNFEYGVLIDDRDAITAIKEDMLKYYSLGNILDKNLLEKIDEEADKLYDIRRQTDVLIESTKLAQLLKNSVDNLDLELLKNRIKEGKTINAIFSDTILYVLKKKGPLSTDELHPVIQAIHPDICDDSIDRVIDGQHFGKKWKHLVRSAQQSLKKKGLIYLKGEKWHLAD